MSANEMARTGHVQPVAKGTVIYRENDQGGEMFIVLKGSVTITMDRKGRVAKLAEIPQGGFFGEMSLLEGVRRTTTAVASSDAILLVVTKEHFIKFISENPEIALRIMQGLSSRVRELNNCLKDTDAFEETITEYVGEGDEGGLASEDGCEELQKLVYEDAEINGIAQYLLDKDMVCPICGSKFSYRWVRDSKLKQVSRTKELRVKYQEIEPMFHDICICPECYYARTRQDFQQANHIEKQKLEDSKTLRKDKYNLQFTSVPTWGFVIKAYKLAIECYVSRPTGKTEDKVAGLWMKLAWIYDDLGDEEKAKTAREEALEKYKSAYAMGTGSDENDHKIEYLVGKVSHSLGKIKDARDYMFKATTRRNGHRMIQQMARDELDELKKED